jgi:hypothetical protein
LTKNGGGAQPSQMEPDAASCESRLTQPTTRSMIRLNPVWPDGRRLLTPMKRLIRNPMIRAFLTRSGKWTRNIAQAKSFQTQDDVRIVCRDLKLDHCQLYYSFSEQAVSEFDFGFEIN